MKGIKIFTHRKPDGSIYYATYWAGRKIFVVFIGEGRNELLASLPRGRTVKNGTEYLFYTGKYQFSKANDAIYIFCE